LEGIYNMGFERPSQIQARAIPTILQHLQENFIGKAPSGTGKTGAFTISMLAKVDVNVASPQVLLIAPTRELARQIYDVVTTIGKFTPITYQLFLAKSNTKLGRGSKFNQRIIIGTPGKIWETIEKKTWSMRHLKMLVWDEADSLANNEHVNVDKIIQAIDDESSNSGVWIQKCMFSATFEKRELIAKYVPTPRNAVLVDRENLKIDPKLLPQYWISVTGDDQLDRREDTVVKRYETLQIILNNLQVKRVIIFCNTISSAEFLLQSIHEWKYPFTSSILHGKLETQDRDRIMADFRSGHINLLITTNVLARGIDVLNVSLVINFDPPIEYKTGAPDMETYLHRVGRTARNGESGLAINLIYNASTKEIIKEIDEYYGIAMQELKLDELKEWCKAYDSSNALSRT